MQVRRRSSRLLRPFEWLDDQLRVSRGRQLLNHIFPDHWSFMLGEIAMYSFILLVLTGVFLALYFVPSDAVVTYKGSYAPLYGLKMSEAYQSVVNLSFKVRAGLLMRQVHHWAANIFIGAIAVHMMRVFFTGAFRRPRSINWLVGATMLLLAIFNGFLGYSLADDMLSGIGVRIAYSITESIPLVGSYLATFLWGGNFPGHVIDTRFFLFHVFILPILIAGLLSVHLMLVFFQEHTEFKKKGASERTITGTPLFPGFMAKSMGFMFMCWGVITMLGAFVQIDPIWQYGPFVAYKASDAAQPDWYMGWLEGALRIWPPLETVFPGHMIPAVFYPAVLLPFLTWVLIYSWPFLEEHFTGDRRHHNLLDHPRDRPFRTAFGVSAISFYFILLVAGGDDVLAHFFQVSLSDVVWGFRISVLVLPVVAGAVTHRICIELQRAAPRTKRPRYVVVERAEAGYYATAEGLPVPGKEELEPIEVGMLGDEAAEQVKETPGARFDLETASQRQSHRR